MTQPGSSPKQPLGFDEFVAIFVAFSTLGTILFFSLPRIEAGLDVSEREPTSPLVDPRGRSSSRGEPEESKVEGMESLIPAAGAGAIVPGTSEQSVVNPSSRKAESATPTAQRGLFVLPLFSTEEAPKATPTIPTESADTPEPDASPEATPAQTAPQSQP